MPAQVSIIMLDNGIQSQNQDYFPSRLVLQKNIVTQMITTISDISNENKLALIPFFQEIKNDIITPIASERTELLNFLGKMDLSEKETRSLSIFQANLSFQACELTEKRLFMFLCSTINDPVALLFDINNILDLGVKISVICFGDTSEFYSMVKEELDSPYFNVIYISENDNFDSIVEKFLFSEFEDEGDENLKLALAQSLVEK